MSNKSKLKPIAAALGTTFLVSMAASPIASAVDNPFSASVLGQSGYMVAEAEKEAEGKCGEGKCGESKGDKDAEGKCGEGMCGESKSDKDAEGKCGEGMCGGSKSE
jgi:uncharacterized low-complexity protein